MFESLENRRMLSITIAGARITVNGTSHSDVLTVEQTGPKSFLIFENGITTTIESNRVVKQLVVNGGGDDDCLIIYPSVTVNTTLNGNYGDDTLQGGSAADLFNGGDGVDTADYSGRQENLRLSINGVADDGKFGEGDNIMFDIENILAGSGNDVIVGQAMAISAGTASETLNGINGVDNFFDGGAGDDDIYGLAGNDLIFGGYGNDSLDGGDGYDTIAGNYGTDYMLGGDGDDLFEANDGEVDTVIGGAGYDTVWADSTLAVDNVNCEDVFLI